MLALLFIALLGVLYVLVVVPWPFPLTFRLLIGLIICWPFFSFYVEVPLPAGFPDLKFHRGGVLLLLGMVLSSTYLAPKPVSEDARERLKRFVDRARNPARARQATSRHQGQFASIPMAVIGYVVLKLVAIINGMATGVTTTAVIAGYLDTTLLPVGLYFLIKSLVTSRRLLAWLIGALMVAALIICLSGLYERALDLTASAFPISAHNDAGDTRYLDVPGGRAAGMVGSPAVYGGIMGMGLLTSLACLVSVKRTRLRLLLSCIAMVFAYGVFVTFTRSVWLSVFVVLAVAQFYLRGLWKFTFPAMVVCALVGAIVWTGLQQNELVQNRVLDDQNVIGRIDRAVWSWQQFLERPILGRGPGALDHMMPKQFSMDGFSTSHNTYLTMLVDNGILVFACFCAVAFRWFQKTKSATRSDQPFGFERSVAVAMFGFVGIWLLCGMSLELSYFPYYNALFWIAGAIIEQASDACVADPSLTDPHDG